MNELPDRRKFLGQSAHVAAVCIAPDRFTKLVDAILAAREAGVPYRGATLEEQLQASLQERERIAGSDPDEDGNFPIPGLLREAQRAFIDQRPNPATFVSRDLKHIEENKRLRVRLDKVDDFLKRYAGEIRNLIKNKHISTRNWLENAILNPPRASAISTEERVRRFQRENGDLLEMVKRHSAPPEIAEPKEFVLGEGDETTWQRWLYENTRRPRMRPMNSF